MAAPFSLGAIAQLGERLHGMQEVAGSSPASSTRGKARSGGLFCVLASGESAGDALYQAVMCDLMLVGEIYQAISAPSTTALERLWWRLTAEMRLLDDLGWGPEDPGEGYALTMPDDELVKALYQLNQTAIYRLRPFGKARAGGRDIVNIRLHTTAACAAVLAQIGHAGPASGTARVEAS
jgi:hypothetical protein